VGEDIRWDVGEGSGVLGMKRRDRLGERRTVRGMTSMQLAERVDGVEQGRGRRRSQQRGIRRRLRLR
jgi:hypothetical protein